MSEENMDEYLDKYLAFQENTEYILNNCNKIIIFGEVEREDGGANLALACKTMSREDQLYMISAGLGTIIVDTLEYLQESCTPEELYEIKMSTLEACLKNVKSVLDGNHDIKRRFPDNDE